LQPQLWQARQWCCFARITEARPRSETAHATVNINLAFLTRGGLLWFDPATSDLLCALERGPQRDGRESRSNPWSGTWDSRHQD